jgi:SagB-type dehydrogenase family enzyme
MQIPADDATTLALWYHLNSGVWSNVEAYQDAAYEMRYKAVSDPTAIPMPFTEGQSAVAKAIEARYSCRRFAARTMPFDKFRRILHSSYGVTALRHEAGGLAWTRWGRAVPSAGGLYPLELYMAAHDVENVPDGVYHFNAIEQQLERLATCQAAEVRHCLLFEDFIQNANLLLMISGVFERTMKKYGPRGYRYVLIEAGHCAQNVCLLAAESDLSTLCLGGFRDELMNRTLGFDERKEAILYCLGIGFAAGGEIFSASPEEI